MHSVPTITFLYCGSALHRHPAPGLHASLRVKGIKQNLEFVIRVTLYLKLLRFHSLGSHDISQGPHVGLTEVWARINFE